ncbi:glycosyl transferase [Agreia sp. Leaf335]|uniref:rhamnosyltransferase WsaF family glycosyltransferase n=1 Tax=Agreia sp. Leaf335 TaxID=1736340 RepID=UPI0006F33452|nr:glycosyltransferase family 1 protein [Agreia sp. Leaf335]KQR24282.1 glycosyl transferase [Agreia sp. Leaf335]
MSSLNKALIVLKEQGVIALINKVRQRFRAVPPPVPGTVKIGFLVKTEDASRVDWSIPHPAVVDPIVIDKDRVTVAWIMSPPGESSGGHQNIFRFMSFLEAAGHTVKIYIYSAHAPYSIPLIKEMIRSSPSYPNISASIETYTDAGVSSDVDAIFATGWETAYPSFLDSSPARRFYFVQDYEPYFYSVGSDAILAENTYRFGFHGITAGGFLAHKLASDFGMTTSSFDFGADSTMYKITNEARRKEVFFYARPVTARRGFELGILALEHFAKARPDYTINLAGWDVSSYDIPFEYTNLKDLKIDQLNEVYNRCATGLVISLTNMSLLPLELLAAGVIPVVNEGPNNRLVSDNPYLAYTAAAPHALGQRMVEIVDRTDLPQYAREASQSVQATDWATSGRTFVKLFEEAIRG